MPFPLSDDEAVTPTGWRAECVGTLDWLTYVICTKSKPAKSCRVVRRTHGNYAACDHEDEVAVSGGSWCYEWTDVLEISSVDWWSYSKCLRGDVDTFAVCCKGDLD